MPQFRTFFIIIFWTFLAGCSGNVSLKGTVTFSDDGSPVPKGTVAFVQGGKMSRGTIKEDGSYVVGTEKEADGIPPGTYQVFISGAKISTVIDAYNNAVHEPLIDTKYENPETSGLSVVIPAEKNTYDIKVDRFGR